MSCQRSPIQIRATVPEESPVGAIGGDLVEIERRQDNAFGIPAHAGDDLARVVRGERMPVIKLAHPVIVFLTHAVRGDNGDSVGDGVTLQILSVFPNFIMQQVRNSLAVRQVHPKGPGETELVWTFYGFEDDDAAMLQRRQRQSNLVGPAGYISMEDGCVGGFVQRGIAGAADERSVVQMGGSGAETQDTRATETSVRGFWKAYRPLMGL